MRTLHHRWRPEDIVGGNAALDLINTVSGWGRDPEDWVPEVSDLLIWARVSGVLGPGEERQAVRLARSSPPAAERALASVRKLRAALRRLVETLEGRRRAGRKDLAVMRVWARRLALARRLVVGRGGLRVVLAREVPALDLPALRVTAAALSLLEDPPAARLKTCAGRDCGWKYLDRSKNRSRRWCDMAVCGNLAKARRFRARSTRARL
jgi:predicted RNA-binding Zn ribbon-like protein